MKPSSKDPELAWKGSQWLNLGHCVSQKEKWKQWVILDWIKKEPILILKKEVRGFFFREDHLTIQILLHWLLVKGFCIHHCRTLFSYWVFQRIKHHGEKGGWVTGPQITWLITNVKSYLYNGKIC